MAFSESNHVSEPSPRATPAQLGTLAKIHSVYEDPLNPKKWTTKYPAAAGSPVENAVTDQHALVGRYKLSEDPCKSLELHSFVVQSPTLRKVLSRVLDGYPGITLELQKVEFIAPFECFVHRWEKLKTVRDEVIAQQNDSTIEDTIENDQTAAHLELLYSLLQNELGTVLFEKQDLVKNGVINFQRLWTIYEPGSLVYMKSDGYDRVYRVKTSKFDTEKGKKIFALECVYVDYDGEQFGMNKQTLQVNTFQGTKKITKLNVYPLIYHQNRDDLKKRLVARGRKFEAYRGHHFVAYEGVAIGKEKRNSCKYNVTSRIIVDSHASMLYNSKTNLEYFETEGEANDAVNDHADDVEDSDEDTVVLNKETRLEAVGRTPTVKEEQKTILSEEQLMLTDSKVRGYSLRDKKWMTFFIDNIKDIEWDEKAFESLVAPPEQKELILSFAESQLKYCHTFDDFIQGKGKGIIMLFSGPPGVGKTLTAESVAETMKAPLYSIGAADLGSKPNNLEKSLQDILEMCTKWGAVLLLDEADVFLENRSTTDLDRNKLIAIFLRLLEYFEGILFLTTNRISNMDPAFESRIHLTLNFHELDKPSRKKVWSTFLESTAQAPNSNVGVGNFSDAELERLAKVQLNGRQIKNVIKAAQLLASRYDECLGMGHLETVLKIRKANERKGGIFFGGGE